MNSDEMWLLQLWSGAIGSFVAAVLGGLVAFVVVRLTNGQQRRLAAEGREKAAIADLLAATAAMMKKYRDGPQAIQDLLIDSEAAAVRWILDSNNEALAAEIRTWPYRMTVLAHDAWDAHDDGLDTTELFEQLIDAWQALYEFGTAWPTQNKKQRALALRQLFESRPINAVDKPAVARDESSEGS